MLLLLRLYLAGRVGTDTCNQCGKWNVAVGFCCFFVDTSAGIGSSSSRSRDATARPRLPRSCQDVDVDVDNKLDSTTRSCPTTTISTLSSPNLPPEFHSMSSGNDALADDGATEPPFSSPVASASPYEEERRILLHSVAESLAKVVGKMGTLNEQLARTADSCREVEEVASVWKEALGGGGNDGDGIGNRGEGDDDDGVLPVAEASSKATVTGAHRSGD